MTIQLAGLTEALKVIERNTSPRYKRLEDLEKWVLGTQYDGLPSWWDDEKPLWERAPCIVYPAVQIAIQSNVDLCLGEGRFPEFTSKPGEDEEEDASGLGEEPSKNLDRFIREHHRVCKFRSHARDAFSAAQGCGTAVAIHGVRNNRPCADLIPAKWAVPQFGVENEVLSLEIRYPYLEEFQKPDKTWAVRPKLYRRTIDDKSDMVYVPADANPNGLEPSWQVDRQRSVPHGLGFCPVVWYPFMRGCVPVNVIDGRAIHAQLLDELRGHDIAISERHRYALLLEGQPYETGVDDWHNPTEPGRMPEMPSTAAGGGVTPANPVNGSFGPPRKSPTRKKGPGYVWRYPDPQTKVGMLTYPADALKAQDENARDIRTKLMQSMAVVLLDHESVQGIRQLSGKALEAIKQAQIDRCDQYRDDLRDNFLLPSIDMQLRIAAKFGGKLNVSGSKQIAAILAKFDQQEPKPRAVA